MILHLWCIKKAHSSPSPLQSAVRNPDCPKAVHHYAFSLCAAASLYSSPCLHEIYLYPAVKECISQVQSELFSGWWCWEECPLVDLFFDRAHMCAHIWANPLISPPGLLSISDGSGAVGDDGCWQDLDYWGEDDGSSCSDRIAVAWDPLEGRIRLLWKLLLSDLQQTGSCSYERAFLQLPLPNPSTFSLTNTSIHRGRPPLSEVFTQHSPESLII